jgi:hypothetical protein
VLNDFGLRNNSGPGWSISQHWSNGTICRKVIQVSLDKEQISINLDVRKKSRYDRMKMDVCTQVGVVRRQLYCHPWFDIGRIVTLLRVSRFINL